MLHTSCISCYTHMHQLMLSTDTHMHSYLFRGLCLCLLGVTSLACCFVSICSVLSWLCSVFNQILCFVFMSVHLFLCCALCDICADVSCQTFCDQEIHKTLSHWFWQFQVYWGWYEIQWLLQKSNHYCGEGGPARNPWRHLHPWGVQRKDLNQTVELGWGCLLRDHKRILLKCYCGRRPYRLLGEA